MARGVEDLGGIGIRVIADASQIKKGFEAELRGFTTNPIKIPITIDDRGQITELKKRLRDLSVPIKVTANRDSARGLKMDLQQKIAAEGGVIVPLKVRNFTSGEGQRIREEIIAGIGPLEVDLVVRWRMEGGPGGPGGGGPAGFFFRPGGGSPRAGGPAVSPPTPGSAIPREDEAAQQQTASTAEPAARPVAGPGSGRRRSRFRQQEGESEGEHRARLREMQAASAAILEEQSTETRKGIKAYNDLISIRQRLGETGPKERLPYPAKVGQDPYPERVDTAGRIVRGPARIGPLASEAGSRRPQTAETVKQGRESLGETFANRELLRQAFGIEIDEAGAVTDIGRAGGQQGLRASNIEAFTRENVSGARQGRRTGRSFFDPVGDDRPLRKSEREALTPEQLIQRLEGTTPEQRQALVEQAQEPTEGWTKFVETMRRGEGGRFINKEARGGKFLDMLASANQIQGGEDVPTGEAFSQALEALEGGDPASALRIASARRGALLGAAFENKGRLPGVGKGTAKRAVGPTREDLPPEATQEQINFIEELHALDAIRGEIFARWDREQAKMRRSAGGETAAETRRGETPRPLTATRTAAYVGGDPVTGEGRSGGGVFEQKMTSREARRAHKGAIDPNDPIHRISGEIEELEARLESARMPEIRARVPSAKEAKGLETELGGLTKEADAIRQAQEERAARLEQTTVLSRATEAGVTPRTQRRREQREEEQIAQEIAQRETRSGEIRRRLALRDVEPSTEAALTQKRAELAALSRREPEPEQITVRTGEPAMAAGEAVAHPVPSADFGAGEGGGEGFFMPFGGFGGGGGPVDVNVQNWPGWMTSQKAMAEGPVLGRQPGEPMDISEQSLRALMGELGKRAQVEAEAEVAEVVPGKGRGKTKAKAKTVEEKEVEEQFGGRARSFSAVINAIQATPGETVNEEQLESARATAERNRVERERSLRGAQEVATTAVQESPSRAVAVAAGQFVQTRFGGRAGILTRKQEADRDAAAALSVSKKLADAEAGLTLMQERRAKITDTSSKAFRQQTAQINVQQTAVDFLADTYGKLAEKAEISNRRVATGADVLKSFGAGVVGTIAGQILFQGVLGAAQKGVELFNMSVGASLERLAGYHEATRTITSALSDQVRASQGAVQQTVAQTAAQSNLSDSVYENIRGTLEQRAAVEAGNKAYGDQLKLLAASRNVGDQRVAGFDRGLTGTTGGVNILGLQTPVGGTASTQELIGQQLEQIPEAPGRRGFNPLNMLGGGPLRDMANFESLTAERASIVGETLDSLNEKLRGSGLRFVETIDQTPEQLQSAIEQLYAAGAEGIANQLSAPGQFRRGVTLAPESRGMSPEDTLRALQLFNERDQRPDPGVLLAGLEERVLPALNFQIRQNLQDTLQTFMPAQRGIQFAAQPVAPFGRGLVPGPGAEVTGLTVDGEQQFEGVPPAATASFDQYRDRAQQAIDAINAKAAEGQRVLADRLGVPESSIAQLRAFGDEIGALNQKQADIRLDLQFTQYNRQLYLAQRTLGDIAGLTGREGSTFVGQLQRQDLLLSRRSQLLALQSNQLGLQTQQLGLQSAEMGQQQNILQLELAQRRVNFQRAAAGFTAPGTTPEERAARIAEAKIEADYAQREIDFQRQQLGIQQQTLKINHEQFGLQQQSAVLAAQQFQNQVALQDALNSRAYEDQAAAIAEMQKSFDASQQLQAIENLKSVITTQRDLFVEEMQAQVQAEEEFIKAQAQFSADIMSQTGEFVEGTVDQVATVFHRVARDFARSGLGRLLGAPVPQISGSSESSGQGGTHMGETFNAPGFVGRVDSPTRMTVGDAGGEEVAILRNPRQVLTAGSSGGGAQFYMPVTITGNNIDTKDDAELAAWADRLTRMVESRLGQRARMYGLGPGR